MLHSFLVLKGGSLCRVLPRLNKSPLFKVLNSGFNSIADFDKVANETLQSLHEYIDELSDRYPAILENELQDGVLTIKFTPLDQFTYVINKQTMNFQIWLSSPASGPKRFDYFEKDDAWIYRRTKLSLHELLQREISRIVEEDTDFFKCQHSGKPKCNVN